MHACNRLNPYKAVGDQCAGEQQHALVTDVFTHSTRMQGDMSSFDGELTTHLLHTLKSLGQGLMCLNTLIMHTG